MTASLEDCDPRLLDGLRKFGDEWGPLGVAIVAASLTSREALIAATEPGAGRAPPEAQQPQPAPELAVRNGAGVHIIAPDTGEIPAEALTAGAQEALRWQWGDRIAMALLRSRENPANAVNATLIEMAEAIVKAAAPHLKAAEPTT